MQWRNMLNGDCDTHNDKFKTCARARPFGNQILESSHFMREHTKPLMTKYSIMNVYHVYHYHCALMCLKILKFRSPISLFEKFNLSKRKPTLLILPREHTSMVYVIGTIWNAVRILFKVEDFSVSVASLKNMIKSSLLSQQCRNDPLEWDKTNFEGSQATNQLLT